MPLEGSNRSLTTQIFGGNSQSTSTEKPTSPPISIPKPPFPWIDRSLDHWKLQVSRPEALALISFSNPPQETKQLTAHLNSLHLQNAFDTYWRNDPKTLNQDLSCIPELPKFRIKLSEDFRDLYKIFSTPKLFDYLNLIRRIRGERKGIKDVYSTVLVEFQQPRDIEESVERGRIQLLNFIREQVKKGTFPTLSTETDSALLKRGEETYWEPIVINFYDTLRLFLSSNPLEKFVNIDPQDSRHGRFLKMYGNKAKASLVNQVLIDEKAFEEYQKIFASRRSFIQPSFQKPGDVIFSHFRGNRKSVMQDLFNSYDPPIRPSSLSNIVYQLFGFLNLPEEQVIMPSNRRSIYKREQETALIRQALEFSNLIQSFSPRQQEIIELYIKDQTVNQISIALGISVNRVSNNLGIVIQVVKAHFGYFR